MYLGCVSPILQTCLHFQSSFPLPTVSRSRAPVRFPLTLPRVLWGASTPTLNPWAPDQSMVFFLVYIQPHLLCLLISIENCSRIFYLKNKTLTLCIRLINQSLLLLILLFVLSINFLKILLLLLPSFSLHLPQLTDQLPYISLFPRPTVEILYVRHPGTPCSYNQ